MYYLVSQYKPSVTNTLEQRCYDVVITFWCRLNVHATLFQRHVPGLRTGVVFIFIFFVSVSYQCHLNAVPELSRHNLKWVTLEFEQLPRQCLMVCGGELDTFFLRSLFTCFVGVCFMFYWGLFTVCLFWYLCIYLLTFSAKMMLSGCRYVLYIDR